VRLHGLSHLLNILIRLFIFLLLIQVHHSIAITVTGSLIFLLRFLRILSVSDLLTAIATRLLLTGDLAKTTLLEDLRLPLLLSLLTVHVSNRSVLPLLDQLAMIFAEVELRALEHLGQDLHLGFNLFLLDNVGHHDGGGLSFGVVTHLGEESDVH